MSGTRPERRAMARQAGIRWGHGATLHGLSWGQGRVKRRSWRWVKELVERFERRFA